MNRNENNTLDDILSAAKAEFSGRCFSILQTFVLYSSKYTLAAQVLAKNFTKTTLYRPPL